MFGHVVTHSSFIQQQSDRAKKQAAEEGLDKARKEVQKGWEEFQRGQKAHEVVWKVQKEQLQALKQKVPKKPKSITKKDWMAGNYPQLSRLASDMIQECETEEQQQIGDDDE